jgi:ABC-type multidrug transport system ATPase subunit
VGGFQALSKHRHVAVAKGGYPPFDDEATMLRIEGLTRRYGSKAAVENVSLDIESGKFIGVIGRSGAGKSTLLRMINRLETPTSGSIRLPKSRSRA